MDNIASDLAITDQGLVLCRPKPEVTLVIEVHGAWARVRKEHPKW